MVTAADSHINFFTNAIHIYLAGNVTRCFDGPFPNFGDDVVTGDEGKRGIVINNYIHDNQRIPLDEETPIRLGSISTACLNALPKALKSPSHL